MAKMITIRITVNTYCNPINENYTEMKRILIPTDFTELGDYAYGLAMNLFGDKEVEIHILSIVSVTPDVLFDDNGELLDDGVIDFKTLHQEEMELAETMDKWLADKKHIKSAKVKIGRLTSDVIKYIEEHRIDLLIMGTSGVSGLKEIMFGSHTAYVAMRSTVPVLSVKSNRDKMEVDKVVLAGDFKDPQMVDLSVLKQISEGKGAEINLLKVNTPGDFETNEEIESRMREFAEINELENVRFNVYNDYFVEKGIIAFSEINGMDIIAIGSRQRTGMSRLIRKSISYEAINHINQPIITFPIR